MPGARLEEAAEEPTVEANQSIAREIIRNAQSGAVVLPVASVQRAGVRFLDAAERSPGALEIANELSTYRSGLVLFSRRFQTVSIEEPSTIYFDLGPFLDEERAPRLNAMAGIQPVEADQAARYEDIGAGMNEDVGIPALRVDGGAVRLDGKDIRHVAFTGVEIHYSGAPLNLENVSFIDCQFVLNSDPPSLELGRAFLALGERVTYRTSV